MVIASRSSCCVYARSVVQPIKLTFARKAMRKAAIWSWLPLLRSSCWTISAESGVHN